MRVNNFNKIAAVYDSLARLVFGRSILMAQSAYLSYLKPNNRVLLIGGGTGFLLSEMDKLAQPLTVIYIDVSSEMIERAKNRAPFKNLTVQYMRGDHSHIPSGGYEIIITPFFLDVFNSEELPVVIDHLSRSLLPNGLWLVTDFVKNNIWWQCILLWLMHKFFSVTVNLSATDLLCHEKYLKWAGFYKHTSKRFYSKMIEAAVYKRC